MGKAKLALGTAQFGMTYGIANQFGQPDRSTVVDILETAMLYDITAWDTSPAYGDSEMLLGHFVTSSSGIFQISSKMPSLTNTGRRIKSSELFDVVGKYIRSSLETLNLNQMSFYFIHDERDFVTYGIELLEILSNYKMKGLINGVGISVYSPRNAMEALETNRIDAIQLPFNLFDQRFLPTISIAADNEVVVFARSIFLQGLFFLSPREADLKVSGASEWIKNLHLLSDITNRSIAELAMCYVRDTLGISLVLVGVDAKEQLRSNFRLFSCPVLEDWELAEISDRFGRTPLKIVNPTLWNT